MTEYELSSSPVEVGVVVVVGVVVLHLDGRRERGEEGGVLLPDEAVLLRGVVRGSAGCVLPHVPDGRVGETLRLQSEFIMCIEPIYYKIPVQEIPILVDLS